MRVCYLSQRKGTQMLHAFSVIVQWQYFNDEWGWIWFIAPASAYLISWWEISKNCHPLWNWRLGEFAIVSPIRCGNFSLLKRIITLLSSSLCALLLPSRCVMVSAEEGTVLKPWWCGGWLGQGHIWLCKENKNKKTRGGNKTFFLL